MLKHLLAIWNLHSRRIKKIVRIATVTALVSFFLFLTPVFSYSYRLLVILEREDGWSKKIENIQQNIVWYWHALTGPKSDQEMIDWLVKNRVALERQAELFMKEGGCSSVEDECWELFKKTGTWPENYERTMLFNAGSKNFKKKSIIVSGDLINGDWQDCFEPCGEILFRMRDRSPHMWWRDMHFLWNTWMWQKHYVYLPNLESMLSQFSFPGGYPNGYWATQSSHCFVKDALDYPPAETQKKTELLDINCSLRHIEGGWFLALHGIVTEP